MSDDATIDFREGASNFAKLSAMLLFDTLLFVVGWALKFLLHTVSDKVQMHGVHDSCMGMLEQIGPWLIFSVAILHVLGQVIDGMVVVKIKVIELWRAKP